MAWACTSSVEGKACGECLSCRQVLSGGSMDLLHVAPFGPSRLIKLEQISGPRARDSDVTPLAEFIMRAPMVARNKVVFIESADRMNSAAANSLLKTLEEPEPRVKLVLTSEAVGAVLTTILSRCLCVARALEPASQTLTEAERIFTEGAPTLLVQFRGQANAYATLFGFFESLQSAPHIAMLGLADRFRALSQDFDEKQFSGVRGVNVELLRCYGLWLKARRPEDLGLRRRVHEAHRRVLGNGSMALQTDPLFYWVGQKDHSKELASRMIE